MPKESLAAGSLHTLSLAAGLRGVDGSLSEEEFSVEIQAPCDEVDDLACVDLEAPVEALLEPPAEPPEAEPPAPLTRSSEQGCACAVRAESGGAPARWLIFIWLIGLWRRAQRST